MRFRSGLAAPQTSKQGSWSLRKDSGFCCSGSFRLGEKLFTIALGPRTIPAISSCHKLLRPSPTPGMEA